MGTSSYILYKESEVVIGKDIVTETFFHNKGIVEVKGIVKAIYDGFATVSCEKGYITCVNFIKNI